MNVAANLINHSPFIEQFDTTLEYIALNARLYLAALDILVSCYRCFSVNFHVRLNQVDEFNQFCCCRANFRLLVYCNLIGNINLLIKLKGTFQLMLIHTFNILSVQCIFVGIVVKNFMTLQKDTFIKKFVIKQTIRQPLTSQSKPW